MKWDFHTKISFFKSGLRIVGYVLMFINLETAATILIISEIVGIIEEL